MMSPEAKAEATTRGAKLLDTLVPGWHKKVQADRLWMSNPRLCLLGQLFGKNAETSIAKEMFPEEWKIAMANDESGYGFGSRKIERLVHGDPELARENQFLALACRGIDTKCDWAREVAERVARDEMEGEGEGKNAQKSE